MWVGAWECAPEYTEVSDLLATGDEDSCELLDVNSWDWVWVFCKSSNCSEL